nr:GNAT family N-acetyltransferase [Bradyrhizobium zhengyangense]
MVTDRAGHHIAIVDWAIVPEMRGRGIGTAILQSLMEEARQTNREIRLKVASSNPAALRLYLRLGFAPVGALPLYTELAWSVDGSQRRVE